MRHSARDLANLADGLTGVQIAEAFLTAASPGVIALSWRTSIIRRTKRISPRLSEAMKEMISSS